MTEKLGLSIRSFRQTRRWSVLRAAAVSFSFAAMFTTATPVTAQAGSPRQSPSTNLRVTKYAESDENFPNPERGYTYQNDPPWPADGVKWDFCGQGNNFTAYNYDAWNTPLTPTLMAERRALGQSVIQSRYHLAAFRTQDLTNEYLTFLDRDFETARQGGIKLVIRFAYNYPFGGPDAPLAQVLRHLDQLKPVLEKNKDVIAFMEAGFVGCWGEWHHSSNGLNYEDRDTISPSQTAILTKVLQVLPKDRMVAMRYPRQMYDYFGGSNDSPIAPLTPGTAFTQTDQARVGIHDDCLVCSDVNGGTFLRDTMARDKAFANQNNLYVVQGGEVGSPESIDRASPQVVNSPLASCDAVRTQFRNQRYSVVGLFDVGSPASSITRWERDGCGPEFQRKVGYRFRMIDSSVPTNATAGSAMNLTITMANDGYARPFNPRQVEVVLRNRATGATQRIGVLTGRDARLWLPAPGETQVLDIAVTVPANLVTGTYDVLVNLPDPEPSLNTRPEFSMRFANQNTWEATTGFNSLQTSVDIG